MVGMPGIHQFQISKNAHGILLLCFEGKKSQECLGISGITHGHCNCTELLVTNSTKVERKGTSQTLLL